MRENGGMKTVKKYEWDGKEVSRSTFFRMQRKTKRRRKIGGPPLRPWHRRDQPFVRDDRIDNERVETFMLIAENVALGDPNERVVVTLPRKILTATVLTLKGAGF